jgi:hypothetical protein
VRVHCFPSFLLPPFHLVRWPGEGAAYDP